MENPPQPTVAIINTQPAHYRELTDEEKAENSAINAVRVKVEHAMVASIMLCKADGGLTETEVE